MLLFWHQLTWNIGCFQNTMKMVCTIIFHSIIWQEIESFACVFLEILRDDVQRGILTHSIDYWLVIVFVKVQLQINKLVYIFKQISRVILVVEWNILIHINNKYFVIFFLNFWFVFLYVLIMLQFYAKKFKIGSRQL